MRVRFERFFEDKENYENRINIFILQLDIFEKNGLLLNKEEVIKGLKESINIQDKETFVLHLLNILGPITELKITQSDIFERTEREAIVSSPNNTRLSEVLYANFEKDRAFIHLAPATELIKKEGLGNFKKEVEIGLNKLAEIIKVNDKIKEIWAISWIVAKNPVLLEGLGFTIVGPIPQEERDEHFSEETRPVAKAFMTREDFLAKYGNQTVSNIVH
jgi:hypothetical protein